MCHTFMVQATESEKTKLGGNELVRSCSCCQYCHHDHQEASRNMDMTSLPLYRGDVLHLTGFWPPSTFRLVCTSLSIGQGFKFDAVCAHTGRFIFEVW